MSDNAMEDVRDRDIAPDSVVTPKQLTNYAQTLQRGSLCSRHSEVGCRMEWKFGSGRSWIVRRRWAWTELHGRGSGSSSFFLSMRRLRAVAEGGRGGVSTKNFRIAMKWRTGWSFVK